MKASATVVTQAGRVVGVQFEPDRPPGKKRPSGRLVAGPGQQAHRLEIERPLDLATPEAVARFHSAVERTLRPPAAPVRTAVPRASASRKAAPKRSSR